MLKTVVRAVTTTVVIDGWGNETVFKKPLDIEPGQCYILENKKVGRRLLSQEELMAESKNMNMLSPEFWSYEKYL